MRAYFDDFKCCLDKGSLSLAERYVEKLHGSYQLDAKQLLQDVYRREFYVNGILFNSKIVPNVMRINWKVCLERLHLFN